MNQEKRNALLSVIFYVIAILTIVLINVSGQFKSGPCTPNLDFLSVFLLAILNIILLIFNGLLAFVLKKETKYSFFVHLLALIIWTIIFFFNLHV
jgi:uncharacterized membrane protein